MVGKIISRLTSIVLTIFIVLGTITTSYAATVVDENGNKRVASSSSSVGSSGINFNTLKVDDSKINGSGAATTVSMIIGAMQWIGYAIAVGMLIFIGIKYVMASADEKANLKNAMIRYAVGAVLIAGGVTIAGWIFNAFAQ